MKEAIRLTNKTAIALRKSAQRVRRAYFAAAVIVSIVLCAAGVALGFLWLPAVPLMIACAALVDCALMVASRSRYLLMIGQAICTEAAARELRTGSRESKRRKQAIHDLMRVKADVMKTQEGGEAPKEKTAGAQPFFEKKAEEEPETDEQQEEDDDLYAPEGGQTAQDAPRRRRRQKSLQLIRSSQAK